MNRSIKNAIIETYKKYGEQQAEVAIVKVISENKYNYFTGQNDAREQLINNINQQKFKEEVFNEYILSVLNTPKASNSLEQAIKETCQKYINEKYLFSILENCLSDFYNGNNHFTRENLARENLENEFKGLDQREKVLKIISKKLVADIKKEILPQITNVEVYGANIEKARQKKITGLTHDKEGSIKLANMQATTSIGKKRSNQEDAVLLKIHPNNPNFKILLVSDGMGGGIAGEEASSIVVAEIDKWFENLPEQYYENTEKLEEQLHIKIKQISRLINDKYKNESGATIVCAIIGNDNTLIANVGDSRAYAVKGKEMRQITKDHSFVQNLYDRGFIAEKDDMRFHNKSNLVTQILGSENDEPQFITLKNNEYDKLLLFTDGVTDCLSDDEIKVITQRTNREDITKEIVESAINNSSNIREELSNNPNYSKNIPGGKDNTTAAVYENER